jgi:hypothetical protein
MNAPTAKTAFQSTSPCGVTWTNQRVALQKDMVFGVCVLSEEGWKPLAWLSREDLEMVRRLCDRHAGNPFAADLDHAIKVAT